MNIKELGEFGLISEIKASFQPLQTDKAIRGIGDDCAIIPQKSGNETLVSTDMLIEGSHFLMEDVDPHQLGWKSAAVNISDIAAMGGRPTATFLSLALPKGMDASWIRSFMDGYREISELYGVPLLGGDTTSSPDRLCINVAILGEAENGTAKLRSTAKAGDLICVTGYLGDSAGGLQAILRNAQRDDTVKTLISRHYLPHPRVNEGIALAKCDGVHALMDISDGIASDLRHILEASGVGAEIDLSSLPISEELAAFCQRSGLDPVELATSGGEDYELLFTIDPASDALLDVIHTVIGHVTESSCTIKWVGSNKDYMGFRHF